MRGRMGEGSERDLGKGKEELGGGGGERCG